MLNPTPQFKSFNFSNPQRDEYIAPDENGEQVMIGTCVSIQEVQAREFSRNGQPGRPRFWPDGNPVLNIRMGFACADGRIRTLTFSEAGKEQKAGNKPSLHMTMFGLTNGNMLDLIGKTLRIVTWPVNPQTGQAWQMGNPRLFNVTELAVTQPYTADVPDDLKVDVVLCNDGASGGQPVQNMSAQQYQFNPTYQQPQQPVYQQQPQPAYQQPQMQQPQMQQPVQPQMPTGMDQQAQAVVNEMGAVNVQPVDPYEDQNIPF